MASTREERLQMRQRGAATRKIKEVDFGFSFGFGPTVEESTSQPALQQPATVPSPPAPPRTNTESDNTTPRLLTPQKGSSRNQNAVFRSGGSRNSLPERPSTFDLPPDDDDEPDYTPSRKRRRFDSPREVIRTSPSGLGRSLQPLQDGNTDTSTVQATVQPTTEVADPNTVTTEDEARASKETSDHVIAYEQTVQEPDQTREAGQILQKERNLEVNGEKEEASGNREEVPQPEGGLLSTTGRDDQAQEDAQQTEKRLAIPDEQQGTLAAKPVAPQLEDEITRPMHEPQEQDQTHEEERPLPVAQEAKINSKEQENPVVQEEARQIKEASPPLKERRKGKRRRPKAQNEKRLSPTVVTTAEREEESVRKSTQPTEISQKQASVMETQDPNPPPEKRQRGQPSTTARESSEENNQTNIRTPTEDLTINLEPNAGRDAEKEDVQLNSEARRTSTRNEFTVRSLPKEREAPSPVRQSKSTAAETPKRRRRPSLQNKTHNAETRQEEEDQAARQEAGGVDVPSTRKRARQPRGDTVPVTVHRLANVGALDAIADRSTESSSGDEDSADELSTRQKTRLLNRGGVNPADVLSQICRETLEKTINTLNNGIANESNAARRSEFTRKKRAVETFGIELEGRMFELSDILDSNYIIGTQLRKSKREMVDLRTRLHRVRKEREAVALRTDAVRRKHAEEEETKMARGIINNSLHGIDLALDRSQNHSIDNEEDNSNSDKAIAAGLEFQLRSVAEDVSPSVPGARGGLLNQIKAFNAQLEATAEKLEGS